MAKSTTPPEPVDDDDAIDIDAELEEFTQDAQENADLWAFLTGAPQPDENGGPKTETVLLFLNDTRPYEQARQEYEDLKFRREALGENLERERPDLSKEEQASYDQKLKDFDAELPSMLERVDATKAKLFERVIVVKLKTPHKISIERAERRARKAAPGLRQNDEQAILFTQIRSIEVLAYCIDSVTLPGGKDATGSKMRATARMLAGLLPPHQWERLANAVNELVYIDGAKNLAISDPGFLAES